MEKCSNSRDASGICHWWYECLGVFKSSCKLPRSTFASYLLAWPLKKVTDREFLGIFWCSWVLVEPGVLRWKKSLRQMTILIHVVTPPGISNIAGWKMDPDWRYISYSKWGIFQPATLVYQRLSAIFFGGGRDSLRITTIYGWIPNGRGSICCDQLMIGGKKRRKKRSWKTTQTIREDVFESSKGS